MEENPALSKKSGPADHMANERTFLAWIRTSIALMSFGFVIVKFALFVHQLSLAFNKPVGAVSKGYSAMIGVMMVSLGALIAMLAFFRYQTIEKQLNTGHYASSRTLPIFILVSTVVVGVLLTAYLLNSI